MITHSMEEDFFNTEVPLNVNDSLLVMENCMLKFCEALQFLVVSLVLSATLAQGYPLGNLLALFLLVMVMLVGLVVVKELLLYNDYHSNYCPLCCISVGLMEMKIAAASCVHRLGHQRHWPQYLKISC